MYLFPDRSAEPLIDVIAEEDRICNYLDIPFQHASRPVLRRMNRPGDGEEYLRFLDRLRRACPKISVRSTFIVGFPGETDGDFAELLQFVEAAQLDWVGVFTFSQEQGSAAAAMPEQVPKRVAQERRRVLMRRQREISAARRKGWIGQEIDVLVEQMSPDGRRGVGRSEGAAPEIDGVVRLRARVRGPRLTPGQFVRSRVTGSTAYDLTATCLPTGEQLFADEPLIGRIPQIQ